MGLLDLFRPKWKHSQFDVRLDAVRQLGEDEVATLTEVARRDPEAKIREVAYKRIGDPQLLVDLARDEVDNALRELAGKRASELSLKAAIDATDDRGALAAVERITEPKMLVDVIRKATSAAARNRALLRLQDQRSLAEVVLKIDDPAIRNEALAKITDAKALKELALSEQGTKAVQMLAIERLSDVPALRAVAERGRSKAARAAAKDRLAALGASSDVKPETQEKKPKKPLDATAEARLKQRKIEASMRRQAEEDRKNAVGLKKARLEAEHAERLQRLEADEAAAKLSPRPEPRKADRGPAVTREERSDGGRERPVEVSAEKAARNAEKAAEAKENAAQLESLLARLESLAEGKDLKEAGSALKEAHTSQAARGPLPDGAEDLRSRFVAARQKLATKLSELREAEDWRRWANVPKLEALITKAESLAKVVIGAIKLEDGQELDAQKVSKELRAMQAEWKAIGGAPKEKADDLWERFKASSDIIYEGNKKSLDSLDEERVANLKMKEELCARVEALVESPDAITGGKAITDQVKQLQDDWKKIGPVPKTSNDVVWTRFRTACDKFFATKKVTFEKQDEARAATLAKQVELAGKAESLSHSVDWKGTADKLKELQDEWKQLGPVPKSAKADSDEAWKKFRGACDHYFEKRKAHFGEMDQERDANYVKKEELVGKAEKLAQGDEVEDADATIRELMGEWKKIGPVAKEKGDEIWARFGKALDALRAPTQMEPEALAAVQGVALDQKPLGTLADKLKMEGIALTKDGVAAVPAQVPVPVKDPPKEKPAPIKEPTPSVVTPAPAPIVEPPAEEPAPAPVKEPTPAPTPPPVSARASEPSPTPIPTPTAPTPEPPVEAPTPAPVEVPKPTPAEVPDEKPQPTPTPSPTEIPASTPSISPSPAPMEVPSSTPDSTTTPTTATQEAWPDADAWSLPDEPAKS